MDDGIHVVQDDPSRFCKTFQVDLGNTKVSHSEKDILGNGLNVSPRSPVADGKIIGNRGQAAQIENKNILSFLVQGEFLAGTDQLERSYFRYLPSYWLGQKSLLRVTNPDVVLMLPRSNISFNITGLRPAVNKNKIDTKGLSQP